MGEFIRYVVSVNLIDGVERPTGNSFYVSAADAQAYVSAADDAARAASNVGLLIAAYLGMTDCGYISTNVGIEVLNDPPPAAVADTVLRGNKLNFGTFGGGVRRDFDTPARKASAFTQSLNSLKVSTASPAAMTAFVGAYNLYVLDAFGNSRSIVDAHIVD